MRGFLAALLVTLLMLCLASSVFAFGAVNVAYAGPAFFLAVLMTLAWTAKVVVLRPVSWKNSPMHGPVLLFVLYSAYRYLAAPIEYEARLELFRVLLYAFIYFYATCNCYRSRDRATLVITLLGIGVAESAYAFWQFGTKATTVLHLVRPEQYQNRGGGTYICPNHLAGLLEMTLALLLARIAIMRSSRSIQKSALKKVFAAYGAFVLLAGLLVTFSRAGWTATLAGFVTFLLLKGWQTRSAWPRVLVGVGGIVILLIVTLRFQPVRDFLHVSVARHAETQELSHDPSIGTRLAMWQASWKMFLDHPGLGTGMGTWKWRHLEYRDPSIQMRPAFAHNDYLHLAAEYGLVGLLIVAAFVVTFFWHASKFLTAETHSDERSFAMGAVTAMVMILVHSFFDFNMHIPANVLVLFGVVGMMAAMDDREKRYRRTEMAAWQRFGLASVLLLLAVAGTYYYGRTFLSVRQANLGLAAKETLDLDAAVNHYEKAKSYDPKSPEAYARLGDIYLNYGSVPARPEQEEERESMLDYATYLYSESLELNPLQSDVIVRLAVTYQRLGDLDAALAAFQGALQLDPQNAFTYFRLGQFYEELGETEKATQAFQRSQELNFWSDQAARLNLQELSSPGESP